MTDPLTAEEIDTMRLIHTRVGSRDGLGYDRSDFICAADVEDWPCPTARLLATLAALAAEQREGLDVERLARALELSVNSAWTDYSDWATTIAHEYVRLGEDRA